MADFTTTAERGRESKADPQPILPRVVNSLELRSPWPRTKEEINNLRGHFFSRILLFTMGLGREGKKMGLRAPAVLLWELDK